MRTLTCLHLLFWARNPGQQHKGKCQFPGCFKVTKLLLVFQLSPTYGADFVTHTLFNKQKWQFLWEGGLHVAGRETGSLVPNTPVPGVTLWIITFACLKVKKVLAFRNACRPWIQVVVAGSSLVVQIVRNTSHTGPIKNQEKTDSEDPETDSGSVESHRMFSNQICFG